ncbi:Forkhead box protein O3 [Dissostichus eleginoides]|uniref:Forkhead box protein O3 n=1 Tax=Dissostichus eleginoides TaxID=100907 RepID=A0AAD9C3X5_DISEL|nr:Forkhead box protein O3 [Dissostichus eleginoides]
MSEARSPEPPLIVEIDPDFEPQKRPRSCTWPLPRPESGDKPGISDVIPEEEDDEDDEDEDDGGSAVVVKPRRVLSYVSRPVEVNLPADDGSLSPALTPPTAGLRKASSRRNAWGNFSYADLISQAIESSPENRLTLAQIYDWMVRSVPYFKDKGDTNSSAGWKNSIRHNLSLHSRFLKLQNEGTGKSSWWILNPEEGKGKAPRRRAVSMDNSKNIRGARGRAAKKKKVSLQEVGSESNFLSKWTGSPASRSSEELDAWTDFRSRTNSNASTLSGRLSPILANLELEGFGGGYALSSVPMLFSSSSSSISPSTLSELNLNDMVSENLLDNVASQQPNEEEEGDSCSVFSFSGAESSPSALGLFTPPCIALRTAPMQTIQENKQTWFSSVCNAQTLYTLDLQSHDLLTQSDPLMSQVGAAAIALQNSRRNATILHKKDPRKTTPNRSRSLP